MLKAPQPGSHDGRSLDPSPLAPPRHLSPDRHRHGSPDLAAHPASPGERGAYAWRGTQLSGRAHPLVFARRAVSREDAAALVFEFAWKTIWVVSFGLPLWATNQLNAE